MINSLILYEGIMETSNIPDTNKMNLFFKITGKFEGSENSSLYLKTLMRELYHEIENSILENIK
jgi:hypothetical protein